MLSVAFTRTGRPMLPQLARGNLVHLVDAARDGEAVAFGAGRADRERIDAVGVEAKHSGSRSDSTRSFERSVEECRSRSLYLTWAIAPSSDRKIGVLAEAELASMAAAAARITRFMTFSFGGVVSRRSAWRSRGSGG